MKILYVMATNGGMGGLEKHTLDLCNGLADHHEIHLIADQSYVQYLPANVQLHAVDFSRSRFNPFLIYELIKIIKLIHPDILHVQASKAASILAPWLKHLDCKKVVTVHGMKSNLKPFLIFDQIIAVSGKIKEKFHDKDKVEIIWNGITLQEVGVQNYMESKYPTAIAIGRLEQVKGFDLLLEAWQGVDANLYIVGDGTQRTYLENKIQQLGLSDRVKLLGHRSDVYELLTSADCMIISSLKEGGPITLAEALFTKTPVLATDVGMVSDFIDKQFICQPNSIDELQQLIKKQLKHKQEMLPNFEEAFLNAQQNLSFEQMLAKTENLYQNV